MEQAEFLIDGSIDNERYRSVAGVKNDPGLLEALLRTSIPASARHTVRQIPSLETTSRG